MNNTAVRRDGDPYHRSKYPEGYVVTRHNDGAPLSKVGDSVWDFLPYRTQPNVHDSKFIITFRTDLSPSWTVALEEILITDWLGISRVGPGKPASLLSRHYSIALFARFAMTRGVAGPNRCDQRLLDSFADLLLRDRYWGQEDNRFRPRARSNERIVHMLQDVKLLWTHRSVLTSTFSFNPWRGVAVYKALKIRLGSRTENKTPPIPREIFGPLFTICWKYISVYSTDILAAQELLPASPRYSQETRCALEIKRNIAFDLIRRRPLTVIDGEPWRPMWNSVKELESDVVALIVACEIVIAFLSGARPGESTALEYGCIETDLDERGCPTKRRVNGWIFKTRLKRKPVLTQWVVIEEVAIALEILSRATERRRSISNTKILFVNREGQPYSDGDYTKSINKLVLYVNRQWPDTIPNFQDGLPWKFNPRQLRRTCARYIAREPFGIIAGARQFRHVAIKTFEGYANYELPENLKTFKQEIDEEHLLAEEDWRDELLQDIADDRISGAGGREFRAEFQGLAADKGDDEAKRILKSQLNPIHIGKLNFCRFRRETAVCLKRAEKPDNPTPIIGLCDEGRCSNSSIASRHKDGWQVVLQDMRWAKTQAPPNSPVRDYLADDIRRVKAIVAKI